MSDARTILLFTRAPQAEARVKQLPLAEGTLLFTGFLRSWQERADEIGAELLVVAPVESAAALARLLPDACVATQSGDSFATRIESAFALAFERGTSAVLMVGGDGPPLPASEVQLAFAHLESNTGAVVLTPANDGGVNAIGFNAHAKRPLAGIAWQSPNVCEQLKTETRRSDLTLLLTSAGHDLDSARNIAPLYRISRAESGWLAFRWLLRSLLAVCRPAVAAPIHSIGEFSTPSHLTRGPPFLIGLTRSR
jgi:glycosyltransferase A (GT-A) superfamily protein (DUF2064 family)